MTGPVPVGAQRCTGSGVGRAWGRDPGASTGPGPARLARRGGGWTLGGPVRGALAKPRVAGEGLTFPGALAEEDGRLPLARPL